MRVAIATGLLVVLLPAVFPAASHADDLDERIPVDPGGLLEVDLDFGEGLRPDPGSLEITSHDADAVRIVADASDWGASGVRFRLDREGRTIRLLSSVGGAFSWMFGGPHVRVRIWVPREFSLDVRCTEGPVRVQDVSGKVRIQTRDSQVEVVGGEGTLEVRVRDGDVRVSETSGSVDVKVGSGDIDLDWITGEVTARTGDGEIRAVHVQGPLALRSASGAIEVREASGPVEAKTERGRIFASLVGDPAGSLETSHGGVRVLIPSDAGVELDAVSRRGTVSLERGITVPGAHDPGRISGPILGGGASLRLYTARGDVVVSRR